MKLERVEAIARAALYEGYNLYPYRPSALKNRQRWTFGSVFPRVWDGAKSGDRCAMQTQCLVRGDAATSVEIRLRFLHIVARDVAELLSPSAEAALDCEPASRPVTALDIDGTRHVAWEEAREREVLAPALRLDRLTAAPEAVAFAFAAESDTEALHDTKERVVALVKRAANRLTGEMTIAAEPLGSGLYRLTVRLVNTSSLDPVAADRAGAQRSAFASTHLVLAVSGGAFVSLTEPPPEFREAAAQCDNQGTWPVLVGDEGDSDLMLSAPIILSDYPRIAPESPGDLFDGCEIDEILTLRILTLTDAEKREMAAADPRTRAMLERTEALTAEEMARLHGTFREEHEAPSAGHAAAHFKVGEQVRLKPKSGGDIMDVVLKDQVAVVEAVERDFEGRVHLAVTILDDPGRDLGMDRMPGHRFFFAEDEVEPLVAETAA